jgi:uncharacterized protein (TIGR03118 family)
MSKLVVSARVAASLILMVGLAQLANAQHYVRTDLTANSAGTSATAAHIDPNLINAWGLTRGSTSPWWVSDNGTGLSTLYDFAGNPQSLVVTIPSPSGSTPSAPTGTVFNFTKGFELTPGKPAVFLFVTEDGSIAGWNPGVMPTTAVIKVNRSGKAVYKGCAIVMTTFGPRLYATNFQTRRVEVFDANFNQIHRNEDAFSIDGFMHVNGLQLSPFNIQNVGGSLVVTFAFKHPGSRDEEHGAGLGQVAVFDPFGRRALRLQHGNWLNAPWGVALTPTDFGVFSHRLLIGNFGSGTIEAFNTMTGLHEGTLLDASGNPITIDGLWALGFGGDAPRNGLAINLFFTAGPNGENDGLFGTISAVSSESRGSSE